MSEEEIEAEHEDEAGEELIVEGAGLGVRIVLVEPAFEGNVGSVCRAMKNFGFGDLWLVRPCPLGDFARAMASHAADVLDEVITVGTLDEALQGVDLLVGTTGKPGGTLKEHRRMPFFTPSELRAMLEDKSGRVAILFGREDCGLSNEELERCDVVVSIPASGDYPILNLSHAAAIVLYELSGLEGGDFPLASGEMLELLYGHLESLLEAVNHPEHKRDKTLLMLRRILGRAMINQREYYTLMGVLRDIELALARIEEDDTSWVENN
jgi:tRNA/rRNA methyltransferase